MYLALLPIWFTTVCICGITQLITAKANDHLFYIYENNDWPQIATASYYKRDPNERLQNVLNGGAGPTVEESSGAYHTDQYQLFSMIYSRALKDSKRTLDPAKATSFIIPYDFASDSAYYKNCARSAGVCFDFRRCPLAPRVEELLLLSPWYQRHHGKDHVLIVGMNYAMDHYILKPKCKSLLSGTCSNCTKFAIDDYSYMYASDAGIRARGDYWHAAPFPADFHWHRHVQRPFPWENTNRPILVSYIGSVRSYYGPSRRLRGSIVHYCGLHPNECVHSSYGVNGTRFSYKVEGHRPLQLSQQSVFCFQPTGDLMTRKGLFDSLLQGCIPVLFDDLTASVMYTWHWEESFWREISVTFPLHPVIHRYSDPVETLMKLYKDNFAEITRKQELIRSRVFSLQYGRDGVTDVYHFESKLPYLTVREQDNLTSSEVAELTLEDRIYHETKTAENSGSSTSDSASTSTTSSSVAAAGGGEAVVAASPPVVIDNTDSNWPKLSSNSNTGDSSSNSNSNSTATMFMPDAYDIIVNLFLGWHSGDIVRFRNATVPECWDGWLDTKNNRCSPGQPPK